MSLLENNPVKMNKTADVKAYHKAYREKNRARIVAYEKTKYYKTTHTLDEEHEQIIKQFGFMSGNVFKLIKSYQDILALEPNVKVHLLKILNEL